MLTSAGRSDILYKYKMRWWLGHLLILLGLSNGDASEIIIATIEVCWFVINLDRDLESLCCLTPTRISFIYTKLILPILLWLWLSSHVVPWNRSCFTSCTTATEQTFLVGIMKCRWSNGHGRRWACPWPLTSAWSRHHRSRKGRSTPIKISKILSIQKSSSSTICL